jgi:nitrogen regulatory protein P-II 1
VLKVEAYIRPTSLPQFHAALVGAGVKGVTVWQTKGIGHEYHESNKREVSRGSEIKEIYIDRVRLDIIVEDSEKDIVIEALTTVAEGGDLGTLKIFVTPVLESIRVPKTKR